MSSRGERKVRELALRRNGDPWDTNDVKELIFAFADDQEDDHAESMERLEAVEAAVSDHVGWTEKVSVPRLEAVEAAVQDLGCIRGEHVALHENHLALEHKHAPRRADDPKTVTFDEQREGEEMRVSFRVGRYILAAIVVIGLTVLVNYFVLYRGQQMQLRTSRSNASDLTALVRQQHQDTIDLLNLLRAEHPTAAPTTTP